MNRLHRLPVCFHRVANTSGGLVMQNSSATVSQTGVPTLRIMNDGDVIAWRLGTDAKANDTGSTRSNESDCNADAADETDAWLPTPERA